MAKSSVQTRLAELSTAPPDDEYCPGPKKTAGRPSLATAKFKYNHRLDEYVLSDGTALSAETFGLSPRIKNQ